MTDLADVRCLAVLGLRRSGRPAALLARRELPAARVVALDEGAAPQDDTVQVLEAAGVEVLTGPAAVLPEDAGLLVKSPGVPDASAAVQEALRRGVPLWSEVEFACRFLSNPVVGITGTNGKTTTTELTGQIFRDARRPVAVGGNIGYALAAMPGEVPADATVVAELSSFQLEHIERFRPAVAVLLNLTEDHLDRHGTYRAYVDAKLRVFENQTADDVAILCADDAGILAELEAGRLTGMARRGWFSAEPGRTQGPDGEELVAGVGSDDVLWVRIHGELRRLCRRDQLALRGDHNLLNSLAAAAAACSTGVFVSDAAATLRAFQGVPHRLQVGGVVDGVTYVNDSKATNVDATLKALTAYACGVHLILGGYDKGAEYDELAVATEGKVDEVLLIGATAPRLEAAFAARRAAVGSRATPYVVCGDLAAAVAAAHAAAGPGDVVLLSPACASWDQYRDYEQRGEQFLKLVSELTTGAEAT
ncbi:MAG TPA: UDP-N-acetylmuramoyl-L-alanine--D-glutamate ligase [Thermoleophilia bacterium]|nr:UDP-N-acetylmuramoyl-L-alanine--D-glutamate ligase [Thermoleophilia bacterium]